MTQAELKEFLHYEPKTGVFTWRVCRGRASIGSVAGTERSDGYRQIRIAGSIYLEHRLAWLYMTGNWPIHQLDHEDTDRGNRAFDNLREATHSQNKMNTTIQSNNITGYKGVHFNENRNKYGVSIKKDRQVTFLGYFDSAHEAGAAYAKAAAVIHGDFANLGGKS